MSTTAERNNRQVTAFYDLMFNQCQPAEAVERFVGATYTQHNPIVADGQPITTSLRKPRSDGRLRAFRTPSMIAARPTGTTRSRS